MSPHVIIVPTSRVRYVVRVDWKIIVAFAALQCSACVPAVPHDEIDDAADAAVSESPKIADLQRRIDALERRDDLIVNYVKAESRRSKAVEKVLGYPGE